MEMTVEWMGVNYTAGLQDQLSRFFSWAINRTFAALFQKS